MKNHGKNSPKLISGDIEMYCPFCQAKEYLEFEKSFSDRQVSCGRCERQYYWRHCNSCGTGFTSETVNAPCINCKAIGNFKEHIHSSSRLRDAVMCECPGCRKQYIVLFIFLNKGFRLCRQCGTLLIIQNLFSGTAKLLALMLFLALLKTPLSYLFGKPFAVALLMMGLVAIAIFAPRYFFTIISDKTP